MATTPSAFQGLGLSILVYTPEIGATWNPTHEYVDSLTDNVSSYQHIEQADGGYWSARFNIRASQSMAEDWIANGLARHVAVYNNAMELIWAGFVNKVSVNLAGLAMTRGPLLDIANRVNVYYAVLDPDSDPPTTGIRARTGLQEDADSQGLYGVLEKYVSIGNATETEADEFVLQYVTDNALPKNTQKLQIGRASEPIVRVECLGYVHFLKTFVFNQTANVGEQQANEKIEDVVDAELNGMFPAAANMADVDDNPLQVKEYENQDRVAWDVVKELVSLGDAADDRWLFGVYLHNASGTYYAWPVYTEAPTTLEYQMRLADPEQRIETTDGTRVMPWNVRAGQWLLFSDLLIGESTPDTLREDPRAMFIERVTYTAPWGLSLQGGDSDKVDQQLAKISVLNQEMDADYQKRQEPNFAWKSAVAAIEALPALRAFWPMSSVDYQNPQALDLAAGGYHLTNNNTALFGADDLRFWTELDGNNQSHSRVDGGAANWADIRGNETWCFGARRGLTLGCWAYFDDLSADRYLLSKWLTGSNDRSYSLHARNTAQLRGFISTNGVAVVQHSSAADLVVDTWFFCAMRFLPSATLDIYLNRDIATLAAGIPATLFDGAASFEAGAFNTNVNGHHDGKLSLCWLCSCALPSVTIWSIFEQTKTLFGVE